MVSIREQRREYAKDRVRETVYLAARCIVTKCSPIFWSYRGLNKAHWLLWRNTVKQLSDTRRKFMELSDELGRDTPAGKRIWEILVAK